MKIQNLDFCARPSQNVVKRNVTLWQEMQALIMQMIKANLANIQPENHQNVQKTHFWQKAPGVNGLMAYIPSSFHFRLRARPSKRRPCRLLTMPTVQTAD